MTYLGISLLALSLPLHSFRQHLQQRIVGERVHSEPNKDNDSDSVQEIKSVPSMDTVDVQMSQAQSCTDYMDLASASACQLSTDHVRIWNHRRHLRAAVFLAPGMFGADYMFNKSLATTSVASCTVLVSTQSIFVFLFAVMLKLESFSMIKLAAVIAGVVGTALTALDDFTAHDDEALTTAVILGDAFALTAAIMYAIYTIQVRQYCPENEELYSMTLLLGYIGAVCAVVMSPIGLYMAYEIDEWTWKLVGIIIAKGLLDFAITDYCMFRAIVLTNATISTVGLGLTIPMAFAADWVLGKLGVVSHAGILGAIFIGVGFLVINIVPEKEVDHKDEASDTSKKVALTNGQIA